MSRDRLYTPPHDISINPPRPPERVRFSSAQTKILTRVMVNSYSTHGGLVKQTAALTVNYQQDRDGRRRLPSPEISAEELRLLVLNFRENPLPALCLSRTNLINISRDTRLPEPERRRRLDRYLNAHLGLIVSLDAAAYPPDNSHLYYGLPAYIPDGLSDMGSDPQINPRLRGREKIRVNKSQLHPKIQPLLLEALWSLKNTSADPNDLSVQQYLMDYIAATVHNTMPYDRIHQGASPDDLFRSILIDEKVNVGEPVSVCRHFAMVYQLCNQALGLPSRLLKCTLDTAHAANLNRLGPQWHLYDVTIPEADPDHPGQKRVFHRPIAFHDTEGETWYLDYYKWESNGRLGHHGAKYTARNNMYYRLMSQPP